MKQEECGRREDKRAGRRGREELGSWEAGWVWWIVGRAAVLSGRFLGRSLQLLAWSSPGHFSAAFERGWASSDGRGAGPKTLLRAKGGLFADGKRQRELLLLLLLLLLLQIIESSSHGLSCSCR